MVIDFSNKFHYSFSFNVFSTVSSSTFYSSKFFECCQISSENSTIKVLFYIGCPSKFCDDAIANRSVFPNSTFTVRFILSMMCCE